MGYQNAGTVEFIVDVDSGGSSGQPQGFFFMEMNTRLQVVLECCRYLGGCVWVVVWGRAEG